MEPKKTTWIDRTGNFVLTHPVQAALYIILFEVGALAALAHFTGCAPRPPVHFENGDRTS